MLYHSLLTALWQVQRREHGSRVRHTRQEYYLCGYELPVRGITSGLYALNLYHDRVSGQSLSRV